MKVDGKSELEQQKKPKNEAQEEAKRKRKKLKRGTAPLPSSSVPVVETETKSNDVVEAVTQAAATEEIPYKKTAFTSSTILLRLSKALERQHDRFENILKLLEVHIKKESLYIDSKLYTTRKCSIFKMKF